MHTNTPVTGWRRRPGAGQMPRPSVKGRTASWCTSETCEQQWRHDMSLLFRCCCLMFDTFQVPCCESSTMLNLIKQSVRVHSAAGMSRRISRWRCLEKLVSGGSACVPMEARPEVWTMSGTTAYHSLTHTGTKNSQVWCR